MDWVMNESPASEAVTVEHGIPWLGFIVYPRYRRIKARNVRYADTWGLRTHILSKPLICNRSA
jgi:hypothetical protein